MFEPDFTSSEIEEMLTGPTGPSGHIAQRRLLEHMQTHLASCLQHHLFQPVGPALYVAIENSLNETLRSLVDERFRSMVRVRIDESATDGTLGITLLIPTEAIYHKSPLETLADQTIDEE